MSPPLPELDVPALHDHEGRHVQPQLKVGDEVQHPGFPHPAPPAQPRQRPQLPDHHGPGLNVSLPGLSPQLNVLFLPIHNLFTLDFTDM